MVEKTTSGLATGQGGTAIAQLRILVVESHEFQRRILVRILGSLGVATVREADNSLKALLILEAEPIDLLLFGHEPPAIDGPELLRNLSQSGQSCSLILTGALDHQMVASVSSIGRELGLPVLGALEKPISAALLEEMLERHGQASQTSSTVITRMSMTDIERGLDRNEFCLHYQPTVSLKNGGLVGCEALLRWEHPELGLLLPAAFLRSMQDRDVMERVTILMYERALTDLQRWMNDGLRLRLYINVAEKFLSQRGAANLLLGVCSDFPDIEPRMVTFDVTEEEAVEPSDLMSANLARLRAKGFGVALDNFAACISSEDMARLPLTEVKLNPSLVMGAAQKKGSQSLLRSCMKLARDLKLITVAEGVERGEDWDFVANAGCHLAQGHLVAKPMEPPTFHLWAKKQTPATEAALLANGRPATPQPSQSFQLPEGDGAKRQPEIGSLVGHYRLESLLGQGGFGKVFRGTDIRLLRPVAVKVLLDSNFSQDKLERFVQEARALARVQHPGIVTIHEIGLEPFQYMVMELLDGMELQEMLKRNGALPPAQARNLAIQMLEALQAVHAKGIVHRDLKPSNIMLDSFGRVRIMDFGIAKILDDHRKLTQTGTFCGTPEYMSPEQIDVEHGGVDERTDLFAVGTILYEMLTGKFTLKGGGIHQVLTQLLWTVPTPPSQLCPNVPEALSLVCMKALEKDKSARFLNAGEFLAALKAIELS